MAAPYAGPAPYAVHTPVQVAPVAHAVHAVAPVAHAVEVAAPVMHYAAVAHQPTQLTYAMPEPIVAQPLPIAHAPIMNYAMNEYAAPPAPAMSYSSAKSPLSFAAVAAPYGRDLASSLPCAYY